MIRTVRALLGRTVHAPPPAVPADVAVVRGRWLPTLAGRLSGLRGHAAAVTLGDTIVVHPDAPLTPRLLRHELAHVRQWRASPLGFPLRYLWYHARFGYGDNPFEVEARRAEHDTDPGSMP